MSYTYKTWGMSYSSTFRGFVEEAAVRAQADLQNPQFAKHTALTGRS